MNRRKVSSFRELNEILGDNKRKVSNYIDTGYLRMQAECGKVYVEECSIGTLVLSDEGEHYYLFYFLSDEVAFELPTYEKPIICEVFYRNRNVDFSFIEHSGFNYYATFGRMGKKSTLNKQQELMPATKEALKMIREQFDCYADSIPRDEASFISENYEIRYEGTKGVLVYDIKNRVSSMNYIFVQNESRGEGIAGKLVEQYFESTGNLVNRYVLWVNERNETAIHLYERYGYQMDGMKKIVWKKDGDVCANKCNGILVEKCKKISG